MLNLSAEYSITFSQSHFGHCTYYCNRFKIYIDIVYLSQYACLTPFHSDGHILYLHINLYSNSWKEM